ncbi:MAG TPA: translation initiation factor IF-3 [Caldisericia bacterium]|nr:translation initiation factor IF-3 [Caldisericia bacterium]
MSRGQVKGYEYPFDLFYLCKRRYIIKQFSRDDRDRNRLRINKEIRSREIRLIDENGGQVGVVDIFDALERAALAGLDLVEISPNSNPPVCKILDYGKYRYELEKKAKENKRKQAHTEIKEMQFRLSVDIGDYKTKTGHLRRFLLNGHKAKVVIRFRGREMIHKEQGLEMLERIAEDLASLGYVEHKPRMDGRRMHMVIAPHKKKE